MSKLGFPCVNGVGECDGCMACQPEPKYYCPVCGGRVHETVIVDNDDDVIGCENCAEIKEPHEVLKNETD